MRRVGIITYHHHYNYGTVLQAYALQKAVERIEGFDSEIIDFISHEESQPNWWQLLKIRIRRLPVYVIEWKRIKKTMRFGSLFAEKGPAFERFFNEDLITSEKTFHTYKSLKEGVDDYDVLMTGSDQTWSPKIGFHPAMFLEFGSPKALRIAYAPSIGVAKLTKEEAGYLNMHLQSFESISCRERLGTELLNKVIKGKKVQNVLDPTFLLTKDDWNTVATQPAIKGDYILCYFIGHKTYYRNIAQQLSKDLNLPLYFIPVSWQDVGMGHNMLPKAGPKEFLGLIRNARLVLTDSFHGTAFAINYRKSFYSFTKIEGGKAALDNSRLYDILSKLRLENRLYDQPGRIDFSDVDYTEVNPLLQKERESSLSYLEEALRDNRICAHNECTGCMACESICSHHAIKIEKDFMGFQYPKKDMDKCVNCGLCSIVCPNNTSPGYSAAKDAYVSTALNKQERDSSTSGGIASVIARYIIKQGGIVYGCTSEDATHIHHIRIDKENDISLLKGSKYVQSDMQGVMKSVKEDLRNGRIVLFVGTPCQVSGLKSFLRKDYNNLYTVDFVCHGVPSQQLLNDIVGQGYESLQGTSVDFRFKDENGHSNYGIKLKSQNSKVVFQEIYPPSRYIAGFLGGLYYRDSCYHCHYAKGERVSDITLGDYWDREIKYTAVGTESLSMIIVNTEQGSELAKAIEGEISYAPITIDALQLRNAQLRKPMARHSDYVKFKSVYLNEGYSEKAQQLLDKEIKRVKKMILLDSVVSKMKTNYLGCRMISIAKKIRK